VPSWTRDSLAEAETRAEQWLTQAGVDVGDLERPNRSGGQRYVSLLARKSIKTDTAARLIDAAFVLGLQPPAKGAFPMTVANRLG
jgi:hypothetical protein